MEEEPEIDHEYVYDYGLDSDLLVRMTDLFGYDEAFALFDFLSQARCAFAKDGITPTFHPAEDGLDITFEQFGIFSTLYPDMNTLRIRRRPFALTDPEQIQISEIPLNLPPGITDASKAANGINRLKLAIAFSQFLTTALENGDKKGTILLQNFPVDSNSPEAADLLAKFGIADVHKVCDFCQAKLPWQHVTDVCQQNACAKTYDICSACIPKSGDGICFRHGKTFCSAPEDTLVLEVRSAK